MIEFTKDIPEATRQLSEVHMAMKNHDEEKAKADDGMACHHCRFYMLNCEDFIGAWHKPCKDFAWW